jgi:thioredoxin reductase (NADPH)
LSIGGVFVEIGSVPNSEFVKDMVKMNQDGEIMIDHRTAKTSKEGIFAAGDVTDDPFKQNNISAGDGVRAALSAYSYLLNIKKHSPCEEPRDE